MIQAIVVEDEALSAQRLKRLLGKVDGDVTIVKTFESVSDTASFLKEHEKSIDLIFLDIHLSDGHSFDIFEKVKVETPIIFTTAYDQYALKAFEQTSVDYLMKPIQLEDLQRSLTRFKTIFQKEEAEPKTPYSELLHLIKQEKKSFKKRFVVYMGSKIVSIAVEEVLQFYAENKDCYLVTKQGKRYRIDYTLEKLKKEVDPEHFFRLNRKLIVHVSAIEEVQQYSRSRYKVFLQHPPSFDVFISTEKMGAFKKWLNW